MIERHDEKKNQKQENYSARGFENAYLSGWLEAQTDVADVAGASLLFAEGDLAVLEDGRLLLVSTLSLNVHG
jgi:phage-related baseplate assembly protein